MLRVLKRDRGMMKAVVLAGLLTVTAGIPGTVYALTCSDCHGNPPVDNASRVGLTTGQFPGSHGTHSGTGAGQYGYACSKCHVNPTAANHASGNVDMAVPINGNAGASYGRGTSFAVSNTTPFVGQTCTATYCHSKGTSVATGGAVSGASPAWGQSTNCNSCHGTESGTSGAPAYANVRANPTAAPTSTGWTTGTNALVEDGAYAVYNTTTAQPLVLTTFNMTAAGLAAGDTVTGISVSVHGLAASGLINVALTKTGNTTVAGTAKTATMPTTDGWVTVNTTPTDLWGTTWTVAELQAANFGVIVKDNDATASNIQIDCVRVVVYTSAEPKMNSHAKHATKTCDVCHNATTTTGTSITTPANHATGSYNLTAKSGVTFTYAYNAAGSTCSTVSCHGNAIWGVSQFDCVSCHQVTQPITAGPLAGTSSRRAVSAEFKSTWSHKRAAAGAVTKYDCVVCHMEGNTDATQSSFHGDGLLQMRDSDLGTTIKGVTFGGTGAGAYTSTAVDSAPARFGRNLASNVIEPDTAAMMVNLCLKCHDADGAMAPSAQVPGGSALKPFATNVASTATYFANNIAAANTVNAVTDVKSSFLSTNASYHPVIGKNNNGFIGNTRLKAPWNTLSPDKTASGTATYGFLISCWDCHAPAGTASTANLTSTVTAHGGATTIRADFYVSATATAPSLCTYCHTDTYFTGSTNHGTGSSFGSGGSSGRYTIANCSVCHGSTNNSRPWRGVDAHGFNQWAALRTETVTPANSLKSGPTVASGHRPYDFIRTNNMAHVNPASVPASDGTWTPVGNKPGCVRGSAACSNSHGAWTPGGAF